MPKKPLSLLVIVVMCLEVLGSFLLQVIFFSKTTLADTAIENAPVASGPSHTAIGSNTVFIDDLIGYKFLRKNTGVCAYRKTTDGGASWGSSVTVDSQTDCLGTTVWFDKWTPGDTGDFIHIATMDSSDDHLFYNRLDTKTDTLLLPTATSTTLGSVAAYLDTQNRHSITKSTDGGIFMTADDDNGSVVVSCFNNCGVSTNWASVGTPPQANSQNTWSLLLPLFDNKVMLINRDSADNIKSSIWSGSSWSSFSLIDSSPRNTTYDVGMSATLNTKTGDIFLAYTDNANFSTSNHDLRTAVYSGGSWIKKTNVFTNISGKGLLQTAISFNQSTDDIYLAYTLRSTISTVNSTNTYFVKSSDGMSSWGSPQGPVNSLAGNFYGLDTNIMSYFRFFVSWFDNEIPRNITGDTMATSSPEVLLRSSGSQNIDVVSGQKDFYLGGLFRLNSIATRTVSSITLTEEGSVDAKDNLNNIKLFYDLDTSYPHTCASESFDGTENQFGATATGGFSEANGTTTFSDSVSISPNSSLCLYVVLDVKNTANDNDKLKIKIADPDNDIKVSGVTKIFPFSEVSLVGDTNIKGPKLVQNAYHFRKDDGSESAATSLSSGNQNTPVEEIKKTDNFRLRIGLGNQGSFSSPGFIHTLEYAALSLPTCSEVTTWQSVNGVNSAFTSFDSSYLTNGSNTTDIALSSGGVSNGATNFLTGNGGVLDTTATSGTTTIPSDYFTEIEYSLQASSHAEEGQTYCFRITSASGEVINYSNFPKLSMSADLNIATFGSQISTVSASSSDVYAGGGFSITENVSGREVKSINLSEISGLDLNDSLKNVKLFYNLDDTTPYTCADKPFSGTELQFGTTSVNGFSPSGRNITFTDSVNISTSSTLCLYVVYDIKRLAGNDNQIKFAISLPADDIVTSPISSVNPISEVTFSSSTLIEGEVLVQTGYHFRNDNGSETAASSATAGNENVPLFDFTANTPIRIRLGITNAGNITTASTEYKLEFSKKITTCALVSDWVAVGSGVEMWNMNNSSYLTNGQDSTNISVPSGGVSDKNTMFLSSNSGVLDTENKTSALVLNKNNFTDLEFSLISNKHIDKNTTYCFRVVANDIPLTTYDNYPEITTVQKRDFFVQRGSVQLSGTSSKLTAGVDYTAPIDATKAFVRITNANYTGAGNNSGGSSQNANDTSVFIKDASDLSNSFTLTRPDSASGNTRVSWEILEFVGQENTDNEIIIRETGVMSFGKLDLEKSSNVISGIKDDSDVVVFITGVGNDNTSKNYYASQITSSWNEAEQKAVLTRGSSGNTAINASYAVVEFVGLNWKVQRAEHLYTASGVTETESITAVNSLSKTFLHTQKRMGDQSTNVLHFGHEVWLSSIGAVSFRLESGANTAMGQTSVAWVIENTQSSGRQMQVQRYSGNTSGGTAPLSLNVSLGTSVWSESNTSITANARASGADNSYPRPLAGFSLTSSSSFQIWRSETGSSLTYRTEIVEWPAADLSLRQNYYRFYLDNGEKTPDTPWPIDGGNLGENTTITYTDNPPVKGDRLRLRINIKANNANLNANFQDFKLQFAERVTTCSALPLASWADLGETGSTSALWRGFVSASTTDDEIISTNPPTPGDLLLSVSDKAGLLSHQNPTGKNPFTVFEGESVEYDWHLENYEARPNAVYCFKIIKADNTNLEVYDYYPQIRTAPFSPVLQNWRWFDDVENKTPIVPMTTEETVPIDIRNREQDLVLRVSLLEKRGVTEDNTKFKLQFSENPSFSNFSDVAATSSCSLSSIWCYTATGPVLDNETIDEAVLSDSASCLVKSGEGCGTYNTTPNNASSSHSHPANKKQEYSFNLISSGAKSNTVYYFRVFDVTNELPVLASSTVPALVTEGAKLIFSISGLPSGTTTDGVTTNIATEEDKIAFGKLLPDNDYIGAQRLEVKTNAFDGYQIFVFSTEPLIKANGKIIPKISSSNSTPANWSSACAASSTGCFGYHSTDPVLKNGSTRFALSDTYAGLASEPEEIIYSSIPAEDQYDIVYRLKVGKLQEAGDYETNITYLAIPSF